MLEDFQNFGGVVGGRSVGVALFKAMASVVMIFLLGSMFEQIKLVYVCGVVCVCVCVCCVVCIVLYVLCKLCNCV